jgi:heterotetrameric sarcosine oxidase alpha subunit
MSELSFQGANNSAFSAEIETQPFRLAKGGLIDRRASLEFRFDRATLSGFTGDTLASALLANGRHLVGRSFKYHRPRGIMTAGSEEPNALVELRAGDRREPNTKATTVELYEGLIAASQNRWPSLEFDALYVNSLLAPFLVAGFYYKTFMWPSAFWERVYEPLIRRSAGLGRAATKKDPDHYEHANAFCDVLVVGGGPAGISAALTAARAGARVIFCEADFCLGGRLLAERQEIDGIPCHSWVKQSIDELEGSANVRLMRRTTVFGAYDAGVYGAIERVADNQPVPDAGRPRQRLWRIVAKRTVLSSGAIERGVVFGGNDRPGVMMASAVRTYVNRFAVAPGRRVVVFTNNDDGWRTVMDLRACGIDVAAIVDSRSAVSPFLQGTTGSRVILGGIICATQGGHRLRSVCVQTSAGIEKIACDVLAVSGGWDPNLGLTCHLGGQAKWSETIESFVPDRPPNGMFVAGAANGTMTLARCFAEGSQAARRALEDLEFSYTAARDPKADDESFAITPMWQVPKSRQKAFVDFQNDVTSGDITLAVREGFGAIEHLKRYTTLGMATDQGKTSSVNGLAILANSTGRSIRQTGRTTSRPPDIPVAIGAFAGHHRGMTFRPVRLTPSHGWAEEQGAVFLETGPWLRAQYFPRAGEGGWLTTVNREVQTVRERVGFCDVSTLGKIELQGNDVGIFLDRLYINTFSNLPVGRARYGLMLREDGFALDDGTTSRLSTDRYFMTTTTANAGRVFQHMQFCHQVLWPELDVQFVSATDQWAQYSVAGPRSRETLAKIVDAPFDISNDAFPYMSVAEITVCSGVPARLYRISFSGELAYEIGVPARYGDGLARELMNAGSSFGIVPYGTEALGVMRIEKGHVAGNELEGRTTAGDLGLGRMMSKKKDFIGRVLSERPALIDPERQTVVGFKAFDPTNRFRAGAHVLSLEGSLTANNDQGVITSVAFSPSLKYWVGLGLLSRGAERLGERLRAVDLVRDSIIDIEVCPSCFVDAKGERVRA